MIKKYFLAVMFGCGFVKAQIFSENFNSAAALPTGWTATNASSTYQWAVGNYAFGGDFTSNVAFFDDDDAGATSMNSAATITSPIINLASFPNAKLSFKYCNVVYDFDTTIKAEVFNGTSWVQVFTHTGDEYDFDLDDNVLLTQVNNIDLTGYTNANFRIRFVYNDAGDYSYGCAVDDIIVSNGILGTSEASTVKKNVEVFPSVTSDYLNIKSASKIDAVNIFDATGRRINIKLDENRVNVMNLPIGNYIISVETKDGKVTRKFIKK